MMPAIGKRLGKKGQIGILIILGIVIAALIVLGVYYKNAIISNISGNEIPKSEIIKETNDINNYVSDCIKKLAEEASDQIGISGGYIEMPKNEIPINLANPLQNRLSVVPGLETAYWFYDAGNGVQKLEVPTIANMQNELADYIDNNLIECTGDFEEFNLKVGYQSPRSSVEILEDSILIETRFPLTIIKGGTTAKLDKFSADVAKPLGKLYGNAKKIMQHEVESNFLEEKTLDMFVVYEQIPYNGIDFECSQKIWSRLDAMRNVKNVISNNVQYLKIKGTDYELVDERHKYFEIDALGKNDKKLGVNFMFSSDWPMLIDILPDDPVLKSESYNNNAAGKFITQFFCLNYYNFVYSVRYPVLIALSENDYTFQFATQAIIDHNQPKQSMVDINYLEGKRARVCEHPLTKINVNVNGYANDSSLNRLGNAHISFKCLGVVCEIGNANENLVFPQCINGLITANNEGYASKEEIVSTNIEQDITMNLEPEYEKKLQVIITNEDGGDRLMIGSEMVLLQFEDTEQKYIGSAIVPVQSKIKLIAGNYKVKATLLSNLSNPLELKEEKIKSCTKVPKKGLLGFFGSTESKCVESTLPKVKLYQAINGGEEFEFSISREELANSNKLIVYVIRNKMPDSVSDIPKVMESINKNSENKYFKMPELK